MERKLCTILALDVVGFSKMMATDEDQTLKVLKVAQDELAGVVARLKKLEDEFNQATAKKEQLAYLFLVYMKNSNALP